MGQAIARPMRWNIFEQICKSDCHRRQKKRPSGVTPTFSFSKTSLSTRIRRNKFWQWDNRNGTGRLHLKATSKNAIKLCPPFNWRKIPIAGYMMRLHYYGSGANEGIGFYAEELMLQNGLFDDSPHTREIIYNFMRLRALRVEVDVKLALGQFSLEEAAKYLEQKVPMDEQTARQEAIAFSTGPGQALTYQIGKLQITKFLAEVRLQQGDKFNLRAFHDFVWKNGNVPIALQRWEYLGTNDDVPEISGK